MLNRRRYKQWLAALERARQTAGRVPWFTLLRAMRTGVVPRRVWRERMRYGCYVCPLFDGERKVCRGTMPPYDRYGCDCFVPYSALTASPYSSGCWGRSYLSHITGFGWGSYQMGRWERLYSPLRLFLRR